MASRSITRFLTCPSKVAHALDWRRQAGNVLSINVSSNKIDLAVASHPSIDDPMQQLPHIPIETEVVDNKKVLKASIAEELATIVRDFQVCGMVISWPLQKEGRCGAQCGRVLNVLDQLAQNKKILNENRPVCLWDSTHTSYSVDDKFGRNALYSRTSDKEEHVASKEQFQDSDTPALAVWNDFMRAQWPELQQQDSKQEIHSTVGEESFAWLDDSEASSGMKAHM